MVNNARKNLKRKFSTITLNYTTDETRNAWVYAKHAFILDL